MNESNPLQTLGSSESAEVDRDLMVAFGEAMVSLRPSAMRGSRLTRTTLRRDDCFS